MRRNVVPAFLTLLLLISCSGQGTSDKGSEFQPPEPCALLTDAEIESVLETPLISEMGIMERAGPECRWTLEDKRELILAVVGLPGDQRKFAKARQDMEASNISTQEGPDIGDDSFFVPVNDEIWVRADKIVFSLQILPSVEWLPKRLERLAGAITIRLNR